jgi:predicted DNA-binding transcriptional regulator AlpA
MRAEEKEYLNAKDCAELLGRSPSAIRNLVMRRRIPFRKPAGRLLFLRREIVQWIERAPGVKLEDMVDE